MLRTKCKNSTTTLYSYKKNDNEEPITEKMQINEALKYINKYSIATTQDISYCIKQVNINNFENLMQDLQRIELFKEKIVEINLWIGNKRASTPWHYDLLDNAIIQIGADDTALANISTFTTVAQQGTFKGKFFKFIYKLFYKTRVN